MSGSSYSLCGSVLTVRQLKDLIHDCPDTMEVHVPSMSRAPGTFIGADHVFIDFKENYVSLDGDISEGGPLEGEFNVCG